MLRTLQSQKVERAGENKKITDFVFCIDTPSRIYLLHYIFRRIFRLFRHLKWSYYKSLFFYLYLDESSQKNFIYFLKVTWRLPINIKAP